MSSLVCCLIFCLYPVLLVCLCLLCLYRKCYYSLLDLLAECTIQYMYSCAVCFRCFALFSIIACALALCCLLLCLYLSVCYICICEEVVDRFFPNLAWRDKVILKPFLMDTFMCSFFCFFFCRFYSNSFYGSFSSYAQISNFSTALNDCVLLIS